jgi:hypothetical protein
MPSFAAGAPHGLKNLDTKAGAELLGHQLDPKNRNMLPHVILEDGMPPRRKGEPDTECLNCSVGAAGVVVGAQQHLMWILAVDRPEDFSFSSNSYHAAHLDSMFSICSTPSVSAGNGFRSIGHEPSGAGGCSASASAPALEAEIDAAISICGGDVRAALRAAYSPMHYWKQRSNL